MSAVFPKFLLPAFITDTFGCERLGSDKLSRLSAFDNNGRCRKVYYVAPLSEDIDLK